MRLQHVSIARVPQNEDITRRFYANLLGLAEIPVPSSLSHLNLMWFKVGIDAELHVLVENSVDEVTNRHFCLVVDNIKTIRETLEKAGHETWDVEDIYGRPRFFCRDPSRNIVEFTIIEDDYLKHQEESTTP